MLKSLQQYRSELGKKIHDSVDEAFKGNAEITMKKITTLIGRCKTEAFKSSVWVSLLEMIGVDIHRTSNMISPIIPMSDGYNFNIFTHEKVLRTIDDRYTYCINGKFDDSITSIIPDDNSSEHQKTVYNFFWKICCEDVELLNYIISLFGIFISGDVRDQQLAVFFGEGNNGKSIVEKIFVHLMGQSCCCLPSGAIYDSGAPMAANSHTSHIDAMKGKRLGINSEARRSRGWNMDIIKRITGGDKFNNRAPHDKTQEDLYLFLHLLIFANKTDLPPVNGDDPAVQKRFLFIPMQAYFNTGKPMKLKEAPLKTYPADIKLSEKLLSPDCMNAFFTLLALGAKHYADNNFTLNIPSRVSIATEEYLADSFPYREFIEEYCVASPEGRCSTAALYKLYTQINGFKCDSSRDFHSIMRKKYNKVKNSIWYYQGISINQAAVSAVNPVSREWINKTVERMS